MQCDHALAPMTAEEYAANLRRLRRAREDVECAYRELAHDPREWVGSAATLEAAQAADRARRAIDTLAYEVRADRDRHAAGDLEP